MKKIKNMFGGSKKDGNVVERTTPPGQDSEARLDEDANRQKERGGEIAFGGRLGDFVSPTGYDAVEEEDIAENPIAQDNNAIRRPLLQAAILEHCKRWELTQKAPRICLYSQRVALAPVPKDGRSIDTRMATRSMLIWKPAYRSGTTLRTNTIVKNSKNC